MKAKRLVIGGWYNEPVLGNGKLIAVYENFVRMLYGDYSSYSVSTDSIGQIPITPEILTKIGFEQRSEGVFTLLDDYFDLTISEYNDGLFEAVYHDCEFNMPDQRLLICYVDELQRFFTDCGIEKDIEL